RLRTLSGAIAFTYAQNTKNRVQISVQWWNPDYPAASDFLYVLLSCASFHPRSDSSINMSAYCNRPLDARMKAALRLAVRDPAAANAKWARIDRTATDAAPMVSLVVQKQIDFVSSRVRNFTFSRQWNWLIDQSWVQ